MKVENKELSGFTKFSTRLANEKLMKLAIVMQIKYCPSNTLSKTIVTYLTTNRAILNACNASHEKTDHVTMQTTLRGVHNNEFHWLLKYRCRLPNVL